MSLSDRGVKNHLGAIRVNSSLARHREDSFLATWRGSHERGGEFYLGEHGRKSPPKGDFPSVESVTLI